MQQRPTTKRRFPQADVCNPNDPPSIISCPVRLELVLLEFHPSRFSTLLTQHHSTRAFGSVEGLFCNHGLFFVGGVIWACRLQCDLEDEEWTSHRLPPRYVTSLDSTVNPEPSRSGQKFVIVPTACPIITVYYTAPSCPRLERARDSIPAAHSLSCLSTAIITITIASRCDQLLYHQAKPNVRVSDHYAGHFYLGVQKCPVFRRLWSCHVDKETEKFPGSPVALLDWEFASVRVLVQDAVIFSAMLVSSFGAYDPRDWRETMSCTTLISTTGRRLRIVASSLSGAEVV